MHPSDQLISRVYNFLTLSPNDKNTVINDLIDSLKNTTLKWPIHRLSCVVELCKELAHAPMTPMEVSHLHNVRLCFKRISSVSELDTCLMFWQITKDIQYWNLIHNITIDPNHDLFVHASMIIKNE